MSLTFAGVTSLARSVHRAMEGGFGSTGRATTILTLASQDERYQPVASQGMPSLEDALRAAAALPARALVLTTACWTAETSGPGVAHLPLADLPMPADLPAGQRGEALVTTAVLHGHRSALRIMSTLTRGPQGPALGAAVESTRELDRLDGMAAFLGDVLNRVHHAR
jgi:hypothetical protein